MEDDIVSGGRFEIIVNTTFCKIMRAEREITLGFGGKIKRQKLQLIRFLAAYLFYQVPVPTTGTK
jgi:hypothetical protein